MSIFYHFQTQNWYDRPSDSDWLGAYYSPFHIPAIPPSLQLNLYEWEYSFLQWVDSLKNLVAKRAVCEKGCVFRPHHHHESTPPGVPGVLECILSASWLYVMYGCINMRLSDSVRHNLCLYDTCITLYTVVITV